MFLFCLHHGVTYPVGARPRRGARDAWWPNLISSYSRNMSFQEVSLLLVVGVFRGARGSSSQRSAYDLARGDNHAANTGLPSFGAA